MWYADVNHQFNVSIPYLTIGNVSVGITNVHVTNRVIRLLLLGYAHSLLSVLRNRVEIVEARNGTTETHETTVMIYLSQITIRTSKFGPTLVILSTEASGGYVLGFRINPLQQLHITHKEISVLRSEFDKFPIFGVEYTFEHQVAYNAY